MAHYLMGLTKVNDRARMQEYIKGVGPTVAQYGGEFIYEASCEDVLEGAFEATSGVVIRFEDAEAARRWYNSPEYKELRQKRGTAGESILFLMRPFGT